MTNPQAVEAPQTPFGQTYLEHLTNAIGWLDSRKSRLHHEGCSVHAPSARCNCGLHRCLSDVRAVLNAMKDAEHEALEREHLGDPDKKTGIYAPQPEAQALPDSRVIADAQQVAAVPVSGVIVSAAQAVVAVRKLHGWSPEADAAIHALEAALASPAPAPGEAERLARALELHNQWRRGEGGAGVGAPAGGALGIVIDEACAMLRRSGPAPAPLSERTFSALQAMTEGILTRGDPDYMGRRLTECVRVMADHGWQTPTPWPSSTPITVTFGPCGIGLDGGM